MVGAETWAGSCWTPPGLLRVTKKLHELDEEGLHQRRRLDITKVHGVGDDGPQKREERGDEAGPVSGDRLAAPDVVAALAARIS